MSIDIALSNDNVNEELVQNNKFFIFCIKRKYITITIIILGSVSLLYFIPINYDIPKIYFLSGITGSFLILITCIFPKLVSSLFERPYWYNDLMCYENEDVSKRALSLFH